MDRLGEWVEEMLPTARSDYLSPMSFIVAVEDVHPTAMNVKPVLRLQGAFLNILARRWIPWTLIEPKVWQPHFGYRKKEHHDSKKWAKMACAQLGFTPEETFKAREKSDICDAYLVARYIQEESHAD